MKTVLILASAALCLGLAASSQAQLPAVSAFRQGGIPVGGGVVGVSGTITNTTSQILTITADTITVLNGSVSQDLILPNPPTPLVIGPNASFSGGDPGFAVSNGAPPFLFMVTYSGSSKPTDITQGTLQLSYKLGTNPTVFTNTFAFPAAATPEPGTLALMGSGLVSGGLLLARRRRK